MAFDEPVDEHNMPKRLNIAFLPKGTREYSEIRKRLKLIEQGTGHEEVIIVDMSTPEGRHLVNGTHLRVPQRPLP